MSTLKGSMSLTIQGQTVTISGSSDIEATHGIDPVVKTLPVGTAGLLNRADEDTGEVTLEEGHGLTNGQYDIHWDGGCRYNMAGTVDSNTLTLDGGAGSDLPAGENVAAVVQKPARLHVSFNGAYLEMIGVGVSRQGCVTFFDADDLVIASVFLVAGKSWGWARDTNIANPLDDEVAYATASNGNATFTNLVKMTGFQNPPAE